MTTKHFSEADLLETYYVQPGQSMPVMMHLAECSECAARYDKLEEKLRGHASCDRERPETFWKRQRIAITRSIDKQKRRNAATARTLRVAAAAIFAFVLGGAVVFESLRHEIVKPQATSVTQVASTAQGNAPAVTPKPADETLEHDAWQSDELREFHSVVEWESWVPDNHAQKGASSL